MMAPPAPSATPAGHEAPRGSLPGCDTSPDGDEATASKIETVTGPIEADAIGLALPHEHLFVDLLGPAHADYCRVDWERVRAACVERLAVLRQLGVDLLVDCTPMGIGRNVGLLRDVSEATGIRIVCATGIYKGNVPSGLAAATPGELARRFASELTTGIDLTGARAGVIKLATTETGPTPRETEVHRAGARAAAATGSAIILHSPQAQVTRSVLATLESEGFEPSRLTWAHAQDSTTEANLELAARGVMISLDAIGVSDDLAMLDRIERLVEAGYADRILVSTDTSVWVNPPEMAYERSIEHLLGTFLAKVSTRLGAALRDGLVQGNVLRTLSRPGPPAEHRRTEGPSISKES